MSGGLLVPVVSLMPSLTVPPALSPALLAMLPALSLLPSLTAAPALSPALPALQRHGASLTLTCVEMCDAQHPPEALCGPEGLLRQVCTLWSCYAGHAGHGMPSQSGRLGVPSVQRGSLPALALL